jgi:hypothetical protein
VRVDSTVRKFFGGMDYQPLLATWPDPRFDERLLREAPSGATTLLRLAWSQYKEGATEDGVPWSLWLKRLRGEGADDEAVQFGLLGLIFLRHEARHHLDVFASSMGSMLASAVAGEYLRLEQLTRTAPGSGDEAMLIDRLRRLRSVARLQMGNVPRFNPGEWAAEPLYERRLAWATFRFRVASTDPGLALATVATRSGTERALSLNALLEARAMLETLGHVGGRLRYVGATTAELILARRLLLELSINLARDDYWVVLHAGLPATTWDDAAELAGGGRPVDQLMAACWFALHPGAPATRDLDLAAQPTLRFVIALTKLAQIDDEQWNRRDLDDVAFDQLQEMVGGAPFSEAMGTHRRRLLDLRGTLDRGDSPIRGLAEEHVGFLIETCAATLALRGDVPRWIDATGWPDEQDPLTSVTWANPPRRVRTAVSRLTRTRNLVTTGGPPEQIRCLAKSIASA